jgi:hypothetical protein
MSFQSQKRPQFRSEYVHIAMLPVGVRLVRSRLVQLLVVPARQALGMPDHVADADVKALHEPRSELERSADLSRVVEDPAADVPTCSIPMAT